MLQRLGASLVKFKSKIAGAIERVLADKLSDTISVKDFGAKGDGVTVDDAAIQMAVRALVASGGGTLYFPRGTYIIDTPIIVESNIRLTGDGRSSIIWNKTTAPFPQTNCIHVGRSKEWSPGAPVVNDASLAELLGGNLTNITTSNAVVDNITVKGTGLGLGIWTLNAQNVHIHDIYSINTTTPINIANDNVSEGKEAACINVTVENIFQLEGSEGHWYDLLFAGSCYGLNVSKLYNNRNSKSKLSEMIVLNGTVKFTVSDVHLIGNEVGSSQQSTKGILIKGGNVAEGSITGCSFSRMTDAVVLEASNGGVRVHNNSFSHCYSPVQLNSSGHVIASNTFESNVIDIAGSKDGINNDIYDNVGVKTFILATHEDPTALSRTRSNTGISDNLISNPSAYAALRARKIAMFPMDAWMSEEDRGNANVSGAIVQHKTSGMLTLFYKIPHDVKHIKSLVVNGYGGGITIKPSIVGIDSDYNVNNLPEYETIASQTTSGDTDYSLTFKFTKQLHMAGTYYLKMELTLPSSDKQVRNVMMNVGCDN